MYIDEKRKCKIFCTFHTKIVHRERIIVDAIVIKKNYQDIYITYFRYYLKLILSNNYLFLVSANKI